jgi:hypothetical protein
MLAAIAEGALREDYQQTYHSIIRRRVSARYGAAQAALLLTATFLPDQDDPRFD